ncbi:MAG TPA: family 20 glycosylhydrolase, partial [bacterium]|nr:family 20 glycosylhydrolase [bacterium]
MSALNEIIIKNIILLPLLILALIGIKNCNSEQKESKKINIIPKPKTLKIGKGDFLINSRTPIYIPKRADSLSKLAEYLQQIFKESSQYELPFKNFSNGDYDKKPGIYFLPLGDESSLHPEGYKLEIGRKGIFISSKTDQGCFYGIQTLRQLLPPDFEKEIKNDKSKNWKVPFVSIKDEPAFTWRGMHLDCCRHFMDKDFIKRYIDLIAYYKLNKMHLHLTEDQGWRLEIKKYPKLTEIGAWRKTGGDSLYGGYYTQEDMKEIINYAQKRFVEVIPEIEMPGHSRAALAAYPEYSCTGGPFEVSTRWGVHKDVFCAGKEETYQFLENILKEVIELFPSQYIHIGGDEVPKNRWEECPDCQSKIANENLKNEHELQSYFIQRMGKFINSHGKQFIGWDEILEGGLAEGAIVQSWRGIEGGMKAARMRHKVIMSPNSHLYFNAEVASTSLKDVYMYNPLPKELNPRYHKYVLGGETCMWTEHAPQNKIDSYMFPRLLAFSENIWNNPETKNYTKFYQRVLNHYKRLHNLGVDYGSEAAPVTARYKPLKNGLKITLKPGEPDLKIFYTLDGRQPELDSKIYSEPIILKTTTALKARAFKNNKPYGRPLAKKFIKHKGFGSQVEYKQKYSPKYTGQGDQGLVNGILGSENFHDGLWQGFEGHDMEVVIKLPEKINIDSISANFLESLNSWIFLPNKVKYYISEDG